MAFRENNAQVFLILLGIAFLLFFPILNNEFWTAEEYEYLRKALKPDRPQAVYPTTGDAHPMVDFFHLMEYKLFGDIPTGYYLLNILLHAVNAFLLYLLIHLCLRDFRVAFLSSLLFVFSVGNYGKEVMYAAGVSSILMHTIFLLTVLAYMLNETRGRGKLMSPWFLITLVLFATSLINVLSSIGIIGVLLFYNIFFKKDRRRPILSPPFLVLFFVGVILVSTQQELIANATKAYPEGSGLGFTLSNFFTNIPRFLIHMVFPIHFTEIIEEGSFVSAIFMARVWIRPLLGIIIFSYAVYGFVFGNTTLRFFIAWAFVTILPFCIYYFPGDWLNIKYLYLSSAGFCLILSTGTMKMYRVLLTRGWRRWVPIFIPAFFIILSVSIVNRLDHAYEHRAQTPQIKAMKLHYLRMKQESLDHRAED